MISGPGHFEVKVQAICNVHDMHHTRRLKSMPHLAYKIHINTRAWQNRARTELGIGTADGSQHCYLHQYCPDRKSENIELDRRASIRPSMMPWWLKGESFESHTWCSCSDPKSAYSAAQCTSLDSSPFLLIVIDRFIVTRTK